MPGPIRQQVLSASPFSAQVAAGLAWPRLEAGKHLVFLLASAITQMSQINGARASALAAGGRLQNAVRLHQTIQQGGLFLSDSTNAYQENWRLALQDLLQNNAPDFDYLELLA